jgi:hypothetical protein
MPGGTDAAWRQIALEHAAVYAGRPDGIPQVPSVEVGATLETIRSPIPRRLVCPVLVPTNGFPNRSPVSGSRCQGLGIRALERACASRQDRSLARSKVDVGTAIQIIGLAFVDAILKRGRNELGQDIARALRTAFREIACAIVGDIHAHGIGIGARHSFGAEQMGPDLTGIRDGSVEAVLYIAGAGRAGNVRDIHTSGCLGAECDTLLEGIRPSRTAGHVRTRTIVSAFDPVRGLGGWVDISLLVIGGTCKLGKRNICEKHEEDW